MADETYSTVNTYLSTNINTNNANSITGALHNTAENKLLSGLGGKLFDSTRPYKTGQLLSKSDTTWGIEVWEATADVAAAAWSAASFTRLSKRSEKLTVSSTPYTGLELGTKTYPHNIGHTNFTIQAFESTGKEIPLFVTAKSSTLITITSSQNYASAVILINEIVIS
jgi:hypothetical protein